MFGLLLGVHGQSMTSHGGTIVLGLVSGEVSAQTSSGAAINIPRQQILSALELVVGRRFRAIGNRFFTSAGAEE